MKLVPTELPARMRRKNLQTLIEHFIDMNIPCVEIVFDETEYKDSKSCYSSFHLACQKSNLPVRCVTSAGKVYLVKSLFELDVNWANAYKIDDLPPVKTASGDSKH